jgi:biotin-dependent carboxylase-like uncharacterized protein
MTAGLRILDPGVASTVQDCGRPGYQRFGVPVSGAVDTVSLAVANSLAGNPPCTGAIEVMGTGLAFRVEADAVTVALAGSAAPFAIENARAKVWIAPFRSVVARRDDVVRFLPPKNGAVIYIAVTGGFDLPPALGSVSTYRRAVLGGFRGRPLAAGDILPLCLPDAARSPVRIELDISPPPVLRVMRGPNDDYFTAAAFEALLSTDYTVSPSSDRMGLRLKGAPLDRCIQKELPSQATTAGALQVTPDGQPILLLADRQTTGGYPRIATVIGADMPAAGRLTAGITLRFQEVEREEAIRALEAQTKWLSSLGSLLKPAPTDELTVEHLLTKNLIDGVTTGSG